MSQAALRVSRPWTRTDTLGKTSPSGLKRNQSPWDPTKRKDSKKTTGENLRPSANGKRRKQPRRNASKSRGCRR
jgi:hypothetical protein